MPRTETFLSRTANILAGQQRRAREHGGLLDYGLEDLRRLAEDALHLPCCYCRCPLLAATFSVDHADPVSRGGGFALENLRVVCRRCNEAKGALDDLEFSDLLALLRTWPDAARKGTLRRLRAGGRALRPVRRPP